MRWLGGSILVPRTVNGELVSAEWEVQLQRECSPAAIDSAERDLDKAPDKGKRAAI
jgi:hypothetical protein